MKEHSINKKNNFISGWYMKDKSICDGIIEIFNNSKKEKGKLYLKEDFTIKKSTDVYVSPSDNRSEITSYLNHLSNCIDEYKKIYIYSDQSQPRWGMTENFNIQKYLPNEGFYKFHCEKKGGDNSIISKRHLVFMTYLNDLKFKGGETEWFYQKIKLRPEKGLTVIWPAEWLFTHRGITSTKETKIIATGWYSFI
jgi:hypothetical protein